MADGWDPDDLPESQAALKADLQQCDAPYWMVKKVEKGFYHDYASPAAMPKTLLIADLREAGIEDLVSEVMNGAYDP